MNTLLNNLFFKGYALMPSFLSSFKVDQLSLAIEKLLKSDTPDIIRCNENTYSYYDIINSNKTHILTREGVNGVKYDAGLIDIFNPDFTINYLDIDFLGLSDFADELSIIGYNFSNFNIYITKGVSCTRPTHFDGANQIKIFIYLTDVYSNDSGPYSYVPYSVLLFPIFSFVSFFRKLLSTNIFYTKNFSFLDKHLTYLLGSKGDLIISNQAGLHRGTPQSPSCSRMVLVANFLKNNL